MKKNIILILFLLATQYLLYYVDDVATSAPEEPSIINQSQVIEGDLFSPADPGTLERFTVTLPEELSGKTLTFSVSAVDEAGNRGVKSESLSLRLRAGVPNQLLPISLGVTAGVLLMTLMLVSIFVHISRHSQRERPTWV